MVEIDIENLPPPPPRPDDREPLIERPQDVAMNQPLDRERVRLPDTSDVYPENTPPTNVEPIPIVEAAPTALPSGPEQWTTPPSGLPGPAGGVPGIGSPIWAVPGAIAAADKPKPAPTTIGPPPAVDRDIAGKVISEIMRDKDRGIGLDLPGAGAIATVVSEVVRGSGTPDIAHATLEVKIAPGGHVSSVRVVGSSAGSAGDWSLVAANVKSNLASREFTLPTAYARGAIVTVDVVSKLQLPDGSTGGAGFQKGGPSSGSIGGGVNFDVSNIGARPKRHVRALVAARPAT